VHYTGSTGDVFRRHYNEGGLCLRVAGIQLCSHREACGKEAHKMSTERV
jgi:hypothetical protein